MAPSIALGVIKPGRRRLRILDPMAGSGTVLAVARAMGHQGIGIDIDPLAVLIAKVWTRSIDRAAVCKKAEEVLNRAKTLEKGLSQAEAYPSNCDPETKEFIRYWFDSSSRRQLAALARAIGWCRNENVRDVLWCGFSRLIIAKEKGASLAKDLAHSRPHRSYKTAPLKPFSGFRSAVERVLANCIEQSEYGRGPAAKIWLGDAREMRVRSSSVDLVLTSPPYLNAIDYLRCSKFTLVWMGASTRTIRSVRKRSVGSEVGLHDTAARLYASEVLKRSSIKSRLSRRHLGILLHFVEDMRVALKEVARVLVPGGRAVYVIGENTIKSSYIPNSKILAVLARDVGLRIEKRSSRTLPQSRRYLPPPKERGKKGALDTRMRREVVLCFRKPRIT
jgi:DNA modification methylase